MLVNLKLKKILPLTVACLMVASGVYAGGPEDQDQQLTVTESVSRRKASELELESQSSKRQKHMRDQEGEEPEVLSPLESLPEGVWMVLLDYLSPSDLLSMRGTSERIRAVASQRDPWQSKYPHFNLSQSWQNGPDGNSFLNTALNIVVHRIQVELGAHISSISRYRRPQPDTIVRNMSSLRAIANDYYVVRAIFDYFDSIFLRFSLGGPLTSFLREERVSLLITKGDAEKRLVQFFDFLNGTPFDKNTPLSIAPKSGEPKPLVELISNELDTRL